MTHTVYLDNAATTAPLAEVIAAMGETMREGFYNPSAFYAPALKARARVEACRRALILRFKAKDAVFTSGGTEADNLAIIGRMRGARKRGRVLFSAAEHPAVREACLSLKNEHEVLPIPLTGEGIVDLDALEGLMTPDTALICVMHVSNEVGSVQPLEEIIKLRDRLCPDAALHVDGVQAFLRVDADMRKGIDSYAVSAHKVHGPKGIGALLLGERGRISPLTLGGGQEKNLRSGTENTPGIAGLSAAMSHFPDIHTMRRNKLALWRLIEQNIPQAVVNGPDPASETACPHILSVSFPPVMAETFMHALEGEGVFVSHGSACATHKKAANPTFAAMGLGGAREQSAVRFSLSPLTAPQDISRAADVCARAYQMLKSYVKR